jgi:Putative Flp pilus-assembly TadE/G-like
VTIAPFGVRAFLKRFSLDEGGAVAILFGVVLTLLLLATGVAIDGSRAVSVSQRAQTALDSAVLAASSVFLTNDERRGIFDKVFSRNFSSDSVSIDDIDFTYTAANGGYGKVVLSYNTSILSAVGRDIIGSKLESRARQAKFGIEVVMVLDVSGSMSAGMGTGTRLDALKSSAKRLIQTLDTAKLPSQSIKYSIVPFTMNVNIGTANTSYVENSADPLFSGTSWAGCVLERPAPYHNQDVYNSGNASAGGRWQAYVWPPEPDSGSVCINPSNGDNAGYSTVDAIGPGGTYDPWTKGPNFNCVRHAVVPLTGNATQISTAIDALTAESNMGTILAPGIAWGHRMLSPAEPFDEGAAFTNATRKIMVVITDGEQTTEGEFQPTGCESETNTTTAYQFDPATFHLDGSALSTNGPRDMFTPYGYLLDSEPFGAASTWATVKDKLSDVSLDACNQFKARDTDDNTVELYAIAASSSAGPGTTVYNLLQQCATSSKHFFYADSDTDLETAFVEIAKNTTMLRLTQ